MTGLELSRSFYESCGRPMLERDFQELLPLLAAGLIGQGSECFGWDDDVSQDHDFEPGFCLFLPGEELVDRRTAFLLERAYAKLPRTFEGFTRPIVLPVGGARRGVMRTDEFFLRNIGSPDGKLSLSQWLSLPEQALLEVTDGAVFYDGPGELTRIRERLAWFPEDVCLKRLAGQLLMMAQTGQYNYPRCMKRGDREAARLAVFEFVHAALAAIFLLNRRYRPYYKWTFRALRDLPILSELADPLAVLIGAVPSELSEQTDGKTDPDGSCIDCVVAAVVASLRDQQLVSAPTYELERLAYTVNDRIRDPEIRNLHILAAV